VVLLKTPVSSASSSIQKRKIDASMPLLSAEAGTVPLLGNRNDEDLLKIIFIKQFLNFFSH